MYKETSSEHAREHAQLCLDEIHKVAGNIPWTQLYRPDPLCVYRANLVYNETSSENARTCVDEIHNVNCYVTQHSTLRYCIDQTLSAFTERVWLRQTSVSHTLCT